MLDTCAEAWAVWRNPWASCMILVSLGAHGLVPLTFGYLPQSLSLFLGSSLVDMFDNTAYFTSDSLSKLSEERYRPGGSARRGWGQEQVSNTVTWRMHVQCAGLSPVSLSISS